MTPRIWAALGLLVLVLGLGYFAVSSSRDGDDRLDRAMAEARAGRIDSSMAILAEARNDTHSDPRQEALRVRLIAAQGDVRTALVVLVKVADRATEVDSLTSVLGTLHESLGRAGFDARSAPPEVVQYALGFGSSPNVLEPLPAPEQVVLEAIHALETGQRVDVAALQSLEVESNELPRFIRVAKVRGAHAPAGH